MICVCVSACTERLRGRTDEMLVGTRAATTQRYRRQSGPAKSGGCYLREGGGEEGGGVGVTGAGATPLAVVLEFGVK